MRSPAYETEAVSTVRRRDLFCQLAHAGYLPFRVQQVNRCHDFIHPDFMKGDAHKKKDRKKERNNDGPRLDCPAEIVGKIWRKFVFSFSPHINNEGFFLFPTSFSSIWEL